MRRLLAPAMLVLLGGCNNDTTLAPSRPITAVTVSPTSSSLLVGQTVTLTASVSGGYGSATVAWTSSNPAVATVSDAGVVTAKAPGTAKITAASGGLSATADVTVTTGVSSVTVTAPLTALVIGQAVQLAVQVVAAIPAPAVTWASSNPAVAAVSANGEVTARGAGNVSITASAGGISGSVGLSVTAGAVDRVVVCDRVAVGSCSNLAHLTALGTSVSVRAFAYNAVGADISSVCTFQWAPSANGVVMIAFVGDASKRDALITRAGPGTVSIVVACGAVPGVFTVDGLEPPPPPATP